MISGFVICQPFLNSKPDLKDYYFRRIRRIEPPFLICITFLLLSQCLRLAAKLRATGVECDLRVWEGLWHVFEFYPIPEAQLSIAETAAFIRAH